MKIKMILKKADISRRHYNYLLAGERNATPPTAKRLARATGTPRELWVFGTASQRKSAIKKLLSKKGGRE